MPNPRTAICIFCEDIRQEIGNKISLMGVYASDIAFPIAPPVGIPKFGIVIWLVFDVGDEPQKVVIRVLAPPARIEIAKLEASVSDGGIQFPYPPDELSKGTLRLVIPLFNVVFSEEGFVEVIAEMDGTIVRAGRLKIRFAVRPEEVGLPAIAASEPLPPSSQSEPDAPESSSPPEPSRPARPARRRRS